MFRQTASALVGELARCVRVSARRGVIYDPPGWAGAIRRHRSSPPASCPPTWGAADRPGCGPFVWSPLRRGRRRSVRAPVSGRFADSFLTRQPAACSRRSVLAGQGRRDNPCRRGAPRAGRLLDTFDCRRHDGVRRSGVSPMPAGSLAHSPPSSAVPRSHCAICSGAGVRTIPVRRAERTSAPRLFSSDVRPQQRSSPGRDPPAPHNAFAPRQPGHGTMCRTANT